MKTGDWIYLYQLSILLLDGTQLIQELIILCGATYHSSFGSVQKVRLYLQPLLGNHWEQSHNYVETMSSNQSSATPAVPAANATNKSSAGVSPPRRFIYSMTDMNHFINSPAKRELLSFITTLGRSTMQCHSSSTATPYDESNPLLGLSPGMASLHGSLSAIASTWLEEIPPDESARARFGNPMFKQWHARLVRRSRGIITCMMDCHVQHVVEEVAKRGGSKHEGTQMTWEMGVLEQCSDAGRQAAIHDNDGKDGQIETQKDGNEQQEKVITELQAYLHQAFGHEIRLDYGTGHECSFYIFLYALCKIGMFGNIPKSTTPSNDIMAPVALSITSQYLQVCRGIQTEYMLEPAGSHGVWGLDDYHCIPFYIGACQLQNPMHSDAYAGYMKPSCILNDRLLNSTTGNSLLYLTCIRYIKSLKKNVPFFESSPMLNDISQLSNWGKVSGGLLRLFEGDVLSKKPVVQHFVFGTIFQASWTPTESQREAPSITFHHDRHGIDSVAPWAKKR